MRDNRDKSGGEHNLHAGNTRCVFQENPKKATRDNKLDKKDLHQGWHLYFICGDYLHNKQINKHLLNILSCQHFCGIVNIPHIHMYKP
jgi:hypothetical protein